MFDKVVFAGGGHRCWWQAGFWEVLRAEIELRPRVIGATSMGAFMACLVHANDSRRALAWYERELAGVRTNMAWLNLFRKDAPLFRQGGIYRKSMRAVLGGEHFRQLLWAAPEIRIGCALPPPTLTERQLRRVSWREYRRDARLMPAALHARSERTAMFAPHVKRLQDCRTERELFDLLQAASALPPLVPPVELDGVPACSGSLVDPVPVDLVADVPGQTLVLTTRTYNRKTPVFALEGRLYVQPSVPLPVGSWDFTSPQRFLKAYEQGRVDAESFLKLFGLGAFQPEAQFGGALLVGTGWTEAPGAENNAEAAENGAMAEEATSDGKAVAERSADADAVAEVATGTADEAETDRTLPAGRADGAGADTATWSSDEGADLPVGIGNDRESQAAAQAAWEDEIDDDPLTLSDDRTVGEPHDKLFERARRAREEGR